MKPPGHASDGLEDRFNSGSAPSIHAQKDTLKPPVQHFKISKRRLRPAKSHTLQNKRKTIAGSVSRSASVATEFQTENIPRASLSPLGLLERGGRLQKDSRNQISQPHSISRPHAQARLKILLVKEAEQRSHDDIYPRVDQQLLGKKIFGRYETLRQLMVKFILTIQLPASPHRGRDNLHNQLLTSPDTRFAAAYLMTRFWFLSGVGVHVLECRGLLDYSWQLAIACIALCVKMQRDFLPPLYPVTNKDLILLAPQNMTIYDLEQAQRDILGAISYSLQGNTPQPFLEELRCSLPTFPQLATTNSAGDLTMKRFWARMFDALLQRDVLFAPISMLAASVLVSVSPAERAAALREEVCKELSTTKHEFEQVSAWLEGVEKTFA